MDPAFLVMGLRSLLEFAQVQQQAKAEGREVTAEELKKARDSWQESDAELEDAIDLAESEGR